MVSPEIAKQNKEMTDKLEKSSKKVTDLTFEELSEAHNIYWNSRMLHFLDGLTDLFKDGYVPNKYEKEALDSLIEQYNINCKSPLATALQESKEEF